MFDLSKLDFQPVYGEKVIQTVTDDQIADLEKHYGRSLPSKYKEILKKYNRLKPKLDEFDIGDETYLINYFYSLTDDKGSVSNIWWAIDNFSSFLGENTLPFAEDASNEIYFFKWVDDKTEVWLLRCDELEEPEDESVIESFDELLTLLHSSD